MNQRLLFILFTIFVIIHQPAGDYAGAYTGMDLPTVTNLIANMGYTFDVIDEPTYDAFILAHQPLQPTAQMNAWNLELSTTIAAVALAAPNYVSSSAVGQIQVNRNMARIIQLRQLLGFQ